LIWRDIDDRVIVVTLAVPFFENPANTDNTYLVSIHEQDITDIELAELFPEGGRSCTKCAAMLKPLIMRTFFSEGY